MLTLLILAPVLFVILILSLLVRLIAFPFRLFRPRHYRRFLGGSPYPGAYSRGFYPRPRFGGLLSIVGLVALDRLFGRRW